MDRSLVVPPRVKVGDTVAIVCPSAPAVAYWPHRVERGRAYLHSLGLRTKLMTNAGARDGFVAGTPEQRAADIHEAFLDPDVSIVLAAIGGYNSNQVLPHLDFDLIAAHPKIMQGYSDITWLLWAIAVRSGLRTFHGPALVPELGEFPAVLPFTDRFMRAVWFGDEPVEFEPAEAWTDEFLNWSAQADLARPRTLAPGSGWRTVREGAADGWLIGGNLETIAWHLRGSSLWPDLTGALLFLEVSEDAPSPAEVDSYLTDLEQIGVFEHVSGLLFGRPLRYPASDLEPLVEVVRRLTERSGIPVVADVDLGHADPMLTLPIGARAHLDASARTFRLLEPATRA
jgi:muramoyltetrapeptide carboxypeptidase LdcA involved in peptidoglycan recycling